MRPEWALTLGTYDDPENGCNLLYIYYINYVYYCFYNIILIMCFTGWLKSVGSQVVYYFDHRKPVLYVVMIENILVRISW